jgi:DNA-binding CsgD family transcriptional regulator
VRGAGAALGRDAAHAYDRQMLYGRDSERAQIAALLEAARSSRSGALVIRGEPGIGKTAVLQDARDLATDMHVLVARGVESESELPFAALHQLLRPALHLLERLPKPQAAALRGALGLEVGGAHERFLVFAGCLSLLAELAERRPVVCLVDDAHWLDDASADALRFVSRRLDAEGIVILFGAREGDVRSFDADDIPSLALAGLDADAAARLLERRAGIQPIPSVRDELVARTRGNALALLEVPLALSHAQLAGDEPLPEALPLTRQLERVFLERVRRLPQETQLLLLLASADDSETMALLNNAARRLDVDLHAFDAAERAGLIAIHGQRLDFRHPLVRSAVYEAATSHERRAAHRALADALATDDEQADRRAWHLGAAALDPDEDVVHALEEAAARAEARAAYMASARALQRAAELSVDGRARGELLAGAARAASLAGQDDRAVMLAKQALPVLTDPALRADLAHIHELAAVRSGRPGDVVPALVAAARELAPSDPARTLQLLVDAADAAWQGGDRDGYLDITRFAATVTPPAGDDRSAAFSASLAGFAAMITGDTGEGVRRLREAAAWGEAADSPRDVVWASYAAQWLGYEERFTALTERATSLARERGELGVLADTLGMRAGQLALQQQFDAASVAASEAIQLARELKADNLQLYPLAALAIVAAVRARDEDVRHNAGYVLELANANGLRLRASMAVYALGLLDLGRGRWLEALERLDTLLEGESVSLDPFAGYVFPEKIEAAVRASRRETADAALPQFETWVGYSGAPAARPRLAACRALLAQGDEATEHFQDALRQAPAARPLDLARIQLLYGEHLRRERRRVDARVQLRTALDAFERFRAEPWAERARAELRATGETARKRDMSTIDQLTPQELQVARYTADGLTNKEIAARLFLSPRTIDAHLRNVFAKLGITSRVQLARLPLDENDGVAVAGAAATA